MSILAMACAMALPLGDPCSTAISNAPGAQPETFVIAMADRELSRIHGMGFPMAGLDREGDAVRVRQVDIAFNQVRTSDETREMFDSWNVQIAVPLIAQATADARR